MELLNLVQGAAVNYGTLVTEALFAVCAATLLGEGESTWRDVALDVVWAVGLYVVECLWGFALAAAGIWVLPGAPSFPALFGTLALYALVRRDLTVADRLVRCTTFVAAFTIMVGMTSILLPVLASVGLTVGDAVPSLLSYGVMIASVIFLRVFSIARFPYVPRHYPLFIVLLDAFGAVSSMSFLTTAPYTIGVAGDELGPVTDGFALATLRVNLVVDVGFLVLTFIAYLLFYLLVREHDRRAELLVTRRGDADDVNLASVTQSMYESLRQMRHELKNHDAYMAALLESGDYDRLREFLSDYLGRSSEVLSCVSSGNAVVDAVTNSKIALARTRGIEVTTMLAVPEELPFDDNDVFRLLANLLDNAIEGTEASGFSVGPIELCVRPEAGYYFVSVSNPCDPSGLRRTSDGGFLTTKRDRDVHGYGIKVVRDIAERYDGAARFAVDGTTFTASVMLVCPSEEG